jgi:hypothetical protein
MSDLGFDVRIYRKYCVVSQVMVVFERAYILSFSFEMKLVLLPCGIDAESSSPDVCEGADAGLNLEVRLDAGRLHAELGLAVLDHDQLAGELLE